MTRIAAAVGAALLFLAVLPATAAELVMIEEEGCIWCARFNREIAPIYPKTPEAERAPLRRVDIRAPRPDDLQFDSPLRLTPTFILVEDGREVARVEGYPGEELFWPMLTRMLNELEESDQ